MSLKILFVIDGLGHGGAERSLAEMLPHFVRSGIKSTVAFFHRHQESLEGRLRAQGADLRFLPEQGVIRRIAALRRLIQMERPDVVHTALFESDVVGRLASIGQQTVVVSSLVNTPYDRIRLQNRDVSAVKLWAVRVIDGWTARCFTTHFHAVTEATKNAAVSELGLTPEHITVIARGRTDLMGPPDAERTRKARLKFGVKDSDEVIVTTGRQEYQKGQRFLLEAMGEIARRRPHAVLLVAGRKGRQSPILEETQQRLALDGRVRLLGHRDDVPELLAASDVFVFPSLYEGLGGSLIEAMAQGLPIVASRIPAIEEVVEEGQNALLVERASVAPLAEAITGLLADSKTARAFGRRSREIFEERFMLEKAASRMVAFYREITAHHPAAITAGAMPERHCD